MGISVSQETGKAVCILHTTFKKIPTWDDCCKLYTGQESAGRGATSKKNYIAGNILFKSNAIFGHPQAKMRTCSGGGVIADFAITRPKDLVTSNTIRPTTYIYILLYYNCQFYIYGRSRVFFKP